MEFSKLDNQISIYSIAINELNRAMLAKNVWDLMRWLDSLLARVLKGWYYHSSNIVHAMVSVSYTWRNLMWGRNLLVKGLR